MSDMKNKIEDILTLFPEVAWDRWTGTLDEFSVFGWVEREDSYKDYVEIVILDGEIDSLSTSSAKYSDEFCSRVGFNHLPCKRIENDFVIPNMIRLGETAPKVPQ